VGRAVAEAMNRGLRIAGYAVVPAAAVLIDYPLAASIWSNPGGPTLFQMGIASPFYLGLLCAPGYLFEVITGAKASALQLWKRWWVRLSLWVALLCGVAGVAGSTMMILFLPPSLLTIILVVLLLRRFESRAIANPSGSTS
jgi:hypothetical protein